MKFLVYTCIQFTEQHWRIRVEIPETMKKNNTTAVYINVYRKVCSQMSTLLQCALHTLPYLLLVQYNNIVHGAEFVRIDFVLHVV